MKHQKKKKKKKKKKSNISSPIKLTGKLIPSSSSGGVRSLGMWHIAIQLILYAMYYSLSSVGNVCYTVYR
jgi:hypothetical protein